MRMCVCDGMRVCMHLHLWVCLVCVGCDGMHVCMDCVCVFVWVCMCVCLCACVHTYVMVTAQPVLSARHEDCCGATYLHLVRPLWRL